ncbi:MAG: ABC-2 transporter permease [Eubacteriales bacterium]|nr:ABC-2 transporter permease [Eubacteriales bacterium]
MKGLLVKDFYTMLRQMKLYLLFILVLSILPNMSLSGLAVVYAAMLPITALAYDERSKWDSLAATMPYSSTDMVLSKYILGYLGVAASCVLTFLIELITGLIKHVPFSAEQGVAILFVGCAGWILLAVNLPFMFWLGVEKGRAVYFVLIALTVFLGMMSGPQAQKLVELSNISVNAILGAVVAASILMNAVSIWISASLYRNKPR